MNCLCCWKKLQTVEDEKRGWHKSCVRHFFGSDRIPELDLDEEKLKELANEAVNRGYTVPGVQRKMSLQLFSDKKKTRLILVNYPTGYILKPQVPEFRALPEAEHLVMCMADASGIVTVPHALLQLQDGFAYITKRIDRVFEKDSVRMLAMEDFCQLDLRLTEDKYRGSYERCEKIVERYSTRAGLDRTELFLRIVFSFLIGNSDMHLKNFSLLETQEGSGEYALSPAYDMLPVNLIMPEDEEELALTLNGKKMNLRKKDFYIFAEKCGIAHNSAEKMIGKLVSMKEVYQKMNRESMLPEEIKEQFEKLIEERCNILA